MIRLCRFLFVGVCSGLSLKLLMISSGIWVSIVSLCLYLFVVWVVFRFCVRLV